MAKLILDATPRRRQKMEPFINYLKRRIPDAGRKVLVEIGSFCGMSTMAFAEIFGHVYAVDAWDVSSYPKGDPDIIAKKGQEHLADAEKTFDHNMRGYPNVTKIKMPSAEAFASWQQLIGEQVDVVYIDALHSYEGCKADIATWGAIATELVMGHDYNRKNWPGVVRAVNEAYGFPDVTFTESSWVHDVKRHGKPDAPMDVYEFEWKLAVFAAAAPETFKVNYYFDVASNQWVVNVEESADNHAVFNGIGVTIEQACRACWNDLLVSYADYGYMMTPKFAPEAEAARRAGK